MTYKTDERLKSYLDTNQLHREQMCRAVLAADKRFSDVRPRHPRGGRDGGRDIQAIYKEDQKVFGAVGFVNQANDSKDQKRIIKKKFSDDLENAISAECESSTTGKAGGLKDPEPLKAVKNLGPPKGGYY